MASIFVALKVLKRGEFYEPCSIQGVLKLGISDSHSTLKAPRLRYPTLFMMLTVCLLNDKLCMKTSSLRNDNEHIEVVEGCNTSYYRVNILGVIHTASLSH